MKIQSLIRVILIVNIISLYFNCELSSQWINKGKYLEMKDSLSGEIVKFSTDRSKVFTKKDSVIYFYDLIKGKKYKELTFSGDVNLKNIEITDNGENLYYVNFYPKNDSLKLYNFISKTSKSVTKLLCGTDSNMMGTPASNICILLNEENRSFVLATWGIAYMNPQIEGGRLDIYSLDNANVIKSIFTLGPAITGIYTTDNPNYFEAYGHYTQTSWIMGKRSSFTNYYSRLINSMGQEIGYQIPNKSTVIDILGKLHPKKDELLYDYGKRKFIISTNDTFRFAIRDYGLSDYSYSYNDNYLLSIDSAVVRVHSSINFDIIDTLSIKIDSGAYHSEICLIPNSSDFLTISYDYGKTILRKFNIDSILPHFAVRFTANRYVLKLNDTIYFKNLSFGNPDNFYWDFGDGSYSLDENPFHIYSKPGKYTVKLVVSNGLQLDSIIKLNIIEVKFPDQIQNDFNDFNEIFQFSPNPATDFLEISIWANGILPENIEIFSVLGTRLLSTPVNLTPTLSMLGEGVRIDVSSLPVGIYFVKVGAQVVKFVKI